MGTEQLPNNMMDRMATKQGLRSQKSQLKDLKSSQIPTDIGLVGQAKLFPAFTTTLPLLTSQPLKFFKLIWVRTTNSIAGFGSIYSTLSGNRKKNSHTGKWEKTEKFRMNERPRIACDLHKRLNTAIPAGDTDTIHDLACSGLEQKVKTRIQVRKQGRLPQEQWNLVRYNGMTLPMWVPWWTARFIPFKAATIVRDYAYPLPWQKKSYIRQIVVRIKSRQSYDKGDGQGIKQKDLTEHVVIQRMVLDNQPKEWMFWGTVEPKTIKDIDELLSKGDDDTNDLGVMEKIRLWMGQRGGMPTGGE